MVIIVPFIRSSGQNYACFERETKTDRRKKHTDLKILTKVREKERKRDTETE
jgi:hypothetical protein